MENRVRTVNNMKEVMMMLVFSLHYICTYVDMCRQVCYSKNRHFACGYTSPLQVRPLSTARFLG